MTRLLLVTGVTLGAIAGWMMLPAGTTPAQAQAPAPTPGRGIGPPAATNLFLVNTTPETRMVPGKVVMWTREQQAAAKSHIQWAPEYRLTATTRQGAEPGKLPVIGEMHTDNTQIYLVTAGSGTVLVEGTVDPKNDYTVAPGEHRGGPIVGGRELKVKVGDLISIPPYAWHMAYGDPGTPLQYLIIHVHTRQTAP